MGRADRKGQQDSQETVAKRQKANQESIRKADEAMKKLKEGGKTKGTPPKSGPLGGETRKGKGSDKGWGSTR